MPRFENRRAENIRELRFVPGFIGSAQGSCLVRWGRTQVLCAVTIGDDVPAWMRGRGRGWLTAEYSMLPASTRTRKPRDGRRGPPDARGTEIQRMIGRVLRGAIDPVALGERTLSVDCDVLEADGGTRTASINGAYVALALALRTVAGSDKAILRSQIAAVSVGIVGGEILVDLDAAEDQRAEADVNIAMDGEGRFLEVQGTGEARPFTRQELDLILGRAQDGIDAVLGAQRQILETPA